MGLRRKLLVCLCLAGCGSETRHDLPNVVLVVADTLRADRLPFYGYPRDTAPFLGEWAARSIVFERAWSTSSWTAPATASLFTGVYPNQHGVTAGLNVFERQHRVDETLELNRIPGPLETLPEFLRSLGYRTFGLADNPNISATEGFEQGFERFASYDDQGAQQLSATVHEWSAEIRGSQPYFLYLHFMDPHLPYRERAPWFQAPVGDDPVARDSAVYDSEIRYLDEHLRAAFTELGVDEKTVVLFVADHGEEFADHGGRYHLFQLYSELTHVPFFLHLPGVPARRLAANVSLIDVLPTLRGLLGQPASEQDAGANLLRCLEGETFAERALFAMRRTPLAHKEAVILGEHKYIVTDYEQVLLPDRAEERELYDLAADPREKNNLAASEPEAAQQLDALWRSFDQGARRWAAETSWITPTPELRALIEQLGYAGGDELHPFVKKKDAQPGAKTEPAPPDGE